MPAFFACAILHALRLCWKIDRLQSLVILCLLFCGNFYMKMTFVQMNDLPPLMRNSLMVRVMVIAAVNPALLLF